MNLTFLRNRQGVIHTLYLLFFIAVATRMLPHFIGGPYQWQVIILLTLYFTLLITEPLLTHRFQKYPHLYFVTQIGIIFALFAIPNETAPHDYFANLFLPLCGQAVWNLPVKLGRIWVAAIILITMGVLQIIYPGMEGVSFGVTYVAGSLLLFLLITMTIRADRARQESQALLVELKDANQKLQDYAIRVERLAATEERNRLARELHDSVSQIIFSMTLTAQAARIVADRDPARIPSMLDHLQELAQNALAEMRSLIEHLRPPPLQEKGLIPALRSHFAERKMRDGLNVSLRINGQADLPESSEEGIFRIIQEALNNVVKHAHTNAAEVTVTFLDGRASVTIADQGAGFDLSKARAAAGHIGLFSMEERVKALGGKLTIESAPGQGTCVRVENIHIKDDSPAGKTQEIELGVMSKDGSNDR